MTPPSPVTPPSPNRQPSGLTFLENVIKEAEEEASLPHDLVTRSMNAAGLVSYRYAARRGLSTKLLAVFDLKLVTF